MRMQAFDSYARAANTAEGSWASVGRVDCGIAFGCVSNMRFFESRWSYVGFGLIDTTACFESSNNYCLMFAQ
jgi:hypothetical protein